MRISHRYRFVFFANPKTGSESMRALLDPISDIAGRTFSRTTPDFPFYSHMRPIEARAEFARRGWPFDDYYRFTFIRNPWARLASLHRMISKRNKDFHLPFSDWLLASRTDGSGGGGDESARARRYGTYTIDNFAGDGNGTLLVDEIFKLEEIKDLPDRLRLRGIPIPIGVSVPKVNASSEAADLRALYSPDLVDLVRERYATEIAKFGYEFPG